MEIDECSIFPTRTSKNSAEDQFPSFFTQYIDELKCGSANLGIDSRNSRVVRYFRGYRHGTDIIKDFGTDELESEVKVKLTNLFSEEVISSELLPLEIDKTFDTVVTSNIDFYLRRQIGGYPFWWDRVSLSLGKKTGKIIQFWDNRFSLGCPINIKINSVDEAKQISLAAVKKAIKNCLIVGCNFITSKDIEKLYIFNRNNFLKDGVLTSSKIFTNQPETRLSWVFKMRLKCYPKSIIILLKEKMIMPEEVDILVGIDAENGEIVGGNVLSDLSWEAEEMWK